VKGKDSVVEEKEKDVGVVLERPVFGDRQIKDLSQLVVGNTYIRHGKGVEGVEVKILTVPYLGDNDSWVDVLSNGHTITTSLADMGISPYSGYEDNKYRWHRYHWVEPLNKSVED